MTRFFAYLLIVISSYLVAEIRCRKFALSLALQDGMLDLIKSIKRSITCYRTPLYEIVNEFENSDLRDIGFLEEFRRNSFRFAYDRHKGEFGYNAFCEGRLLDFISKMGTLPLVEQIVACEDLIAVLTQAFDEKKEDYPKQKKLYVTLGICAGLSIVILLI